MRVIVDANVFLSALLPSATSQESTIFRLFERVYFDDHALLVAEETLVETRSRLSTKAWLAKRVDDRAVDAFLDRFGSIAERLPALAYPPPPRCRDRKDDYLLEQAIRFAADVLVTGDGDLLALDGEVDGLRIVQPRALLDELTTAS